jgi:hypothetical protein
MLTVPSKMGARTVQTMTRRRQAVSRFMREVVSALSRPEVTG